MNPSDKSENVPHSTTKPKTKLTTKGDVTVNRGKPVWEINWSTLKCFAFITSLLLIINIILSLRLFYVAVDVSRSFGYFINLIARPDGDILPSLLAIPTLVFLIIDIIAVYLLYKLFSEKPRSRINCLLFTLIILGVLAIVATISVLISVLVHIYSEHTSLHDGMMDAMKLYSTDATAKSKVDYLQIEYQCCGSKKYEDWYKIPWYDVNLVVEDDKSEHSSTPFSCCSMTSMFPCIHHDIEKTGTAYLYTPEFNLSITTTGCFDILKKKKKGIGWLIIGDLITYLLMQTTLLIFLRFMQTAHTPIKKFDGRRRTYVVWLCGCYQNRNKTGGKFSGTGTAGAGNMNETRGVCLPPQPPPAPAPPEFY